MGDISGAIAQHHHGQVAPDDTTISVEIPLLHAKAVTLPGINLSRKFVLPQPVIGVCGAADVFNIQSLLSCKPDQLSELPIDVVGAGSPLGVDFSPGDADGSMGKENPQFLLRGPQFACLSA